MAVCFSILDLYNSGPSSVHTETHITRSKMAFSNLFSRLSAVDEGMRLGEVEKRGKRSASCLDLTKRSRVSKPRDPKLEVTSKLITQRTKGI